MKDINSVGDLINLASEYAEFAINNLTLEISIEKRIEISPVDDFVNAVAGIAAVNPQELTSMLCYRKYEILFMFPNLSAEERKILQGLSNCKMDERPAKLAPIEGKLTALQMELLESDYFEFEG